MGFAAPSLLRLAAVRLAHRRGAALVVAAGVAVATAGLIGATVAGTHARERSVAQGIAQASAEQRSVRVSVFETSGAGNDTPGFIAPTGQPPPPDRTRYATQLDPHTTRALPTLGFGDPVTRGIVVAPARASVEAGSIRIVALDDLPRWARVESGRLPARDCGTDACEAVYLGGGDATATTVRVGKLALPVVGRARLDPGPVGVVPPRNPQALGAGSAFYAVSGVEQVAGLRAFADAARTYTWMRELGTVHPWDVTHVLAGIGRARAMLVAGGNADFATPAPLLAGLDRRGRASSARIALIAGMAAAVLLAFAAFAAAQRRPDLTAELDRLLDAGAARRHTGTLVAAESLALALAGAALGLAVAAAVAAAAGAATAFAHTPGIPVALAGVVLTASLILAAAAIRSPPRYLRAIGEAAVFVALALIAWQAASRGALDARELAGGGGADPVILILPALVGLAGAALVVRVTPALLRVAERATRRAGAGVRLFALGLARNAGLAGATVAMVSVAAATGLFALAYASELRTGSADQAAYATGDDLRVRDQPDVLPLARGATPVIRVAANRLDTTGRSIGAVSLLGIPAGTIAATRGWRADFSDTDAKEIDRRLGPARSLQLAGDALPADARRLTLPVVVKGDAVAVTLSIQTREGRFTDVQVLSTQGEGRFDTTAAVPEPARGGRVIAVRVDLLPLSGSHSDYGGVRLGTLRADGRRVTGFGSWKAGEGAQLSPDGARVRLSYPGFRQQRRFLAVHEQPGEPPAVPALVSRDLAAAPALNGRLPVAVAGSQVIRIRPVATAERFPTLPEGASFAVVDAGALSAAVNQRVAGAAVPGEAWIRLSPGAASPALPGAVASRAAAQRALERDPLGEVTVTALWAAAVVSLGLAAVAILLSALVALRDADGELAELEAIGIAPRSLRRQVRASAAVTALIGGAGALVSAAVLSRAFLGLAHVTAEGRDPLPPLAPDLPWLAQLAALALAALVAAAAVLAVSRRALRGDRVGRLRG